MEPISSIVMALALGAAAGLKPIAEQAIKDCYAGLKEIITRKFPHVNVGQLETNPQSKNRRGVLEEELAAVGAQKDADVLCQAEALLELIRNQIPQTAAVIGVDLKDIEGATLAIRRVTSTGSGVKVKGATLSGDIIIEDVQTGGRGGSSPNV